MKTAARCGPPLVYQFAVQPISSASRERYQHLKELVLDGPGHHGLDLFIEGPELGVSLAVVQRIRNGAQMVDRRFLNSYGHVYN